MGTIEKIIINTPSAQSFAKDAECGHLVIDEKRIRFFLAHAKPNNEYNYSQELLVGDCSAEGTVLFKDGRKIQLSIDNWTGWGGLSDRRTTYFMRCEPCTDILEPDFPFDPSAKDPWR